MTEKLVGKEEIHDENGKREWKLIYEIDGEEVLPPVDPPTGNNVLGVVPATPVDILNKWADISTEIDYGGPVQVWARIVLGQCSEVSGALKIDFVQRDANGQNIVQEPYTIPKLSPAIKQTNVPMYFNSFFVPSDDMASIWFSCKLDGDWKDVENATIEMWVIKV